jgi:hypothetical protein
VTAEGLDVGIRCSLGFCDAALRTLLDDPGVLDASLGSQSPLNLGHKVFVESALLLDTASRVLSRMQVEVDLEATFEMTDSLLNRAEVLDIVTNYPQTAAAFGVAEIALRGVSEQRRRISTAIDCAFASGDVYATERVPYRQLDVGWVGWRLAGRKTMVPPPPHEGILNTPFSALGMPITDKYAVTHTVMYATDLGAEVFPFNRSQRTEIIARVDSILSAELYSGNLDLIAELLLSLVLLDAPLSEGAIIAWKLLSAEFHRFDCLPGPTFDPAAFARVVGQERVGYVLRHCYHTTFVYGILCLALRSRPQLHESLSRSGPSNRWMVRSASNTYTDRRDWIYSYGPVPYHWDSSAWDPAGDQQLTDSITESFGLDAARWYWRDHTVSKAERIGEFAKVLSVCDESAICDSVVAVEAVRRLVLASRHGTVRTSV